MALHHLCSAAVLGGTLALFSGLSLCSHAGTPLLQHTSTNIALFSPSTISDLFDKANTAQEQGRYQRAEQYWRQVIEEFSPHSGAWVGLGHALKAQGYLSDAEAAYKQAININSTDALAYESLGDVLILENRDSEALKAYSQAIQIEPDRVSAYVGQGNALYYLGRLDDAIRTYQEALKLRPNYAYAYVALGNVLKYREQFSDAVQAYKRATELSPKYAYAFTKLGQALSEQELLPEALAAYKQAEVTLSTCDTELLYSIGDTYLKQAKVQEAQRAYASAGECGASILDKRFLGIGLMLAGIRDSALKFEIDSDGNPKAICDLRIADGNNDPSSCFSDSVAEEEPIFQELVNKIFYPSSLQLTHESSTISNLFDISALDIDEFKLKVDRQPDSADANASFGIALALVGKSDEAIQFFEKSVTLDPKLSSVGYLAGMLIAGGKRQTVMDIIDRSALKNPDGVHVYLTAANHLLQLNRPKEANLLIDTVFGKYQDNDLLLLAQIPNLILSKEHSKAQQLINRLRKNTDRSLNLEDHSSLVNHLTQFNQRLGSLSEHQDWISEVKKIAKEEFKGFNSSEDESANGFVEAAVNQLDSLVNSSGEVDTNDIYETFTSMFEKFPGFENILRSEGSDSKRFRAQLRSYIALQLAGQGTLEPQAIQQILSEDPRNLIANVLKVKIDLVSQDPQSAFNGLNQLVESKSAQRAGLSQVLLNSINIAVNRIDKGVKVSPFREKAVKAHEIQRSVVAILPGSEISSDTDSAKSAKCGTGVVIARKSNSIYIVTARHVLTNQNSACRLADEYRVEFYSQPSAGQQRLRLYAEVVPETIQSSVVPEDLAILRVVGGVPRDIQPFALATSPPLKESFLSLIGHPGDEEWVTTPAILQHNPSPTSSDLILSLPDYPELQAVPGYSGGAIIDKDRKLVGLFTNTNSGGSAYSSNSIRSLMEKIRILP